MVEGLYDVGGTPGGSPKRDLKLKQDNVNYQPTSIASNSTIRNLSSNIHSATKTMNRIEMANNI